MGRLYDRQDLAWNLNFWNQHEQQLSADIARGLADPSILNKVITYPSRARIKGEGAQYLDDDLRPSRHMPLRACFEYERQRERFKLLRTGQLLHNLDAWQKIFKACPKCHTEASKRSKSGFKDVPCAEHEEGYRKAKSDVFWAGEHNVEERNARGQRRDEGVATTQDVLEGPAPAVDNGLNKWESLYHRDKAEGQWTPDDARRYDVEFSYKGWLRCRWEDEEISEAEYLTELERLRAQERELEELRAPTDREAPTKLPKHSARGALAFRRDSRFTHLAN